jgi:protein-disulfide isomerase
MAGYLFALFVALSLLLQVQPSYSQSAEEFKALENEVKALKEGQQAIQKEIQEIKSSLRAQQEPPAPPAFKETVMSIEGYPFMGNKDAKLTIIEFSDYQCPFCSRHLRETMPQIEKDYVKTGKLKYVFRNYPLPFHQQASKAAEAANCAGDQGKFWEMHDRLYANQNALDEKNLPEHAKAVGLDLEKFQDCLSSGKHAQEIKKDIEDGQKVGIDGTPSFLLGFTEANGARVKAVKMIVGAQPFTDFKEAIDSLLEASGK